MVNRTFLEVRLTTFFQTTKANRMKIREVLVTDMYANFVQNISEDDDLYSDCDNTGSEMKSDDTSIDEYISEENESDSYFC